MSGNSHQPSNSPEESSIRMSNRWILLGIPIGILLILVIIVPVTIVLERNTDENSTMIISSINNGLSSNEEDFDRIRMDFLGTVSMQFNSTTTTKTILSTSTARKESTVSIPNGMNIILEI